MILILTSGRQFAVHFHHQPYVHADVALEREINAERVTSCSVHEITNSLKCRRVTIDKSSVCDTVAINGAAKCSRKDNFSRELGRRIAFGRAIKQYETELRDDLMAAYNSYEPPKKNKPMSAGTIA